MADFDANWSSQSNSKIDKDLQKLECPFTWIMDDITKEDDSQYHLNDDEEFFPLLQLMRQIMTVYVDTNSKIESDEILEGLEKCDDIMVALKESDHPEISTDAVHYVVQSTQCFVFKKLKLPEKLKRVHWEIQKDWKMNNKEKSTLMACRSICWSKYHRIGSSEAEAFIRNAIKENPNCELWHFILGKNLRRQRRDSTITIKPSAEEISCFETAYNMSSSNPVFGVFLAQMYREAGKMVDAKRIYNKIFDQNPVGTTILLRLALGFIRMKLYMKAKECLDKVEAVAPKHSMYLHYRGIYHLDKKHYKEAAKFLKQAAKDCNIPAEKQYLECAVRLDPSFNIPQYLHEMLEKYNHLPEVQVQPILLDLALTYWLRKRDITKTIKYFTMAVEIKPEATCITNYYSTTAVKVDEKNMYKLLVGEILPMVNKYKEDLKQTCIDNAEELQNYCNSYFKKNVDQTLNSFSKLNVRNK